MLSKANPIRLFCFALVIFSQTTNTYACYLEMYGYSSGSNFHQRAGGMSFKPSMAKPVDDSKFQLSLPSMIRGKADEQKALTVSYSHSDSTEDTAVQILVKLMPGIKTVGENTVRLKGKSGEHTFMLQPQQSGIFRLIVTARDVNDKDIPVLREAVYVNIFN